MPVEVATDASEAQDIPVEETPSPAGENRQHRTNRTRTTHVEVEVEREVTRRRLIESVTSIVLVVLYMIFTLLRERDAGVVVLDDDGPEDDWKE